MFILFDVGATKTRVGISRDGKAITGKEVFETPESFDDGVGKIVSASLKLAGKGKIDAVAGGVAASFYQGNEKIYGSPNLLGWEDKPFKKILEEKFKAPVFLENDAAICGLGEAVRGAGKGEKIVMYVTVSTGVGGARIVDGKIDKNTYGFQPGQQIIDIDGTLCPSCNSDGKLEEQISGAAAERRFKTPPKNLQNPLFWEEQAKWLAYGLYNSILHWSPDVVVLGGSMITGEPAIPLEVVDFHLKDLMIIFPKTPPLKKAALGDDGGLLGALEYLKQMI